VEVYFREKGRQNKIRAWAFLHRIRQLREKTWDNSGLPEKEKKAS
jgi:hypothetical protein